MTFAEVMMDTTHTHNDQTLYLQSNRGYYVIHPNGDIERTDMVLPPSGQWKMVGLVHRNARSLNSLIRLEEITSEWIAGHQLINYRVVDFDHGTIRTWGNDKLVNIWIYASPQDTPYYHYRQTR